MLDIVYEPPLAWIRQVPHPPDIFHNFSKQVLIFELSHSDCERITEYIHKKNAGLISEETSEETLLQELQKVFLDEFMDGFLW